MTKTLISARLSDVGHRKLGWLSQPARYGTQTTALEVAIDRLYQEALMQTLHTRYYTLIEINGRSYLPCEHPVITRTPLGDAPTNGHCGALVDVTDRIRAGEVGLIETDCGVESNHVITGPDALVI